jgi:tartrate dehydratase beta subunit/fumarate hydratase class I family protein
MNTAQPGGSLANGEWLCYSLEVARGAKQNKAKHLQTESTCATLWKSQAASSKPETDGLANREWLCYSLEVARGAKQNKAKHLQTGSGCATLWKSQAANRNSGRGLQTKSGYDTLWKLQIEQWSLLVAKRPAH